MNYSPKNNIILFCLALSLNWNCRIVLNKLITIFFKLIKHFFLFSCFCIYLESRKKIFFWIIKLFFVHIKHLWMHKICYLYIRSIFTRENYFINFFCFKLFDYNFFGFVLIWMWTFIKFWNYQNDFFLIIFTQNRSNSLIKFFKHLAWSIMIWNNSKNGIDWLTIKCLFQ